MARNGGRSSAPGNSESLVIGMLAGMVLGLALAGGVAWYIMKKPNTSPGKEQAQEVKQESEKTRPAATASKGSPPAQHAASSVGESRERFTFYTILTEKGEVAPPQVKNEGQKAHVSQGSGQQPAALTRSYYLQAGSFASPEDADKLKARIALAGLEANVAQANIPGKGIRYRVRLGPYRNADDLNKAREALKQNGIADATPMPVQ